MRGSEADSTDFGIVSRLIVQQEKILLAPESEAVLQILTE